MQGHVQSKLLLDDGHQDVDGDGDPDLGLHGVLGGAVEALDAQVLLDPLEEQFDLPAATVQRAMVSAGRVKLLVRNTKRLVGLGIAIADAAKRLGVVLSSV